jgi:tRNA(fMet)-specific endonuclease VapC
MDTDHLSVLLETRHRQHAQLVARLERTDDTVALPIAVVEEHLRGWLAQIRRVPDVHKQIFPYIRLQKFMEFARDWQIVGWNEPAADIFKRLRKNRIRIGTQDLKIAAITLANEAILLSSNSGDFEKIPELRVEDWLYGPENV